MRILLRKIHGVFGATLNGAPLGASMPVYQWSLPNIFSAFSLLMLVPLLLLATIVGLVSLVTAPAAPAAVATDFPLVPVLFVGTVGPFTTNTLLGVLENLKRPNTGLLNAFFSTTTQSQDEYIHFDIDEGQRFLAPFVHPLVEAPVKEMRGQRVETFTPAYVKEKARWTPDRALRRSMGEAIGGSLSPEQRRDLALANELQDQMDRIMRRKEAMAFEALFSGRVTVVGDKYPSTVVTFGRSARLEANAVTNNLTGGNRWSETTSNPMDNLDDLSETTVELAGSPILDVILDAAAWKAFRKNKKVERDLELPKYDAGTIMSLEPVAEGLQYKGAYGGYRIWLYTGFYTAANGTETKTMEGGHALCVGAIEGVQHQGAIQDEEAGMQPLEIFPKSWVTPDPSVRWIMSQSAPLVVPRRINACGVLKVLNAS